MYESYGKGDVSTIEQVIASLMSIFNTTLDYLMSFIEEDLKLARGSAWLPTANILAIAAVCPYAGYLQDLFGKRYIALFGSLCICLGCTLLGTAHNFAQALAGMALSGVGAAIGELTGLAG